MQETFFIIVYLFSDYGVLLFIIFLKIIINQKQIAMKKTLILLIAIMLGSVINALPQGVNCKLGGNNNVGINDWIGSQNYADFLIKANNQQQIKVGKDGTIEFYGYVKTNSDSTKIKGLLKADSIHAKYIKVGDSSLWIGSFGFGPSNCILSNDGIISLGLYSLLPGFFSNVHVGIGTQSPLFKLHLFSGPKGPKEVYAGFQNTLTGPTLTDGFLVGIEEDGTAQLIQQENADVIFKLNNVRAGLLNDALRNTSWGVGALSPANTGTANTANGYYSLANNRTGNSNTATGVQALYKNTTASQNTALGYQSLYNQSFNNGGVAWNSDNVAIGYQALFTNNAVTGTTEGIQNTAVGNYALYKNTTGYFNTANGFKALTTNTTGSANTAIGYYALGSNTTGIYNTAIGYYALGSNTTESENTAIGYYALGSNTTGFWNTANGFQALQKNTSGTYNTATGIDALLYNTTGYCNTANGGSALQQNKAASNNVAIGLMSLFWQSYDPGYAWNSDNVAVGYLALYNNQPVSTMTGRQNTAIGKDALLLNTTGAGNTALGYTAGQTITTNRNNTCVGYGADIPSTYTNCTFLGYNGGSNYIVNNNHMQLGNSSVTQINAAVSGLTQYSDRRIKNNINENVPGLAFINLLKPVTFHIDLHLENSITGYPTKKDSLGNVIGIDTSYWQGKYDIEKINYTGLIGQQVDSAAQQIGYDFYGISRPNNANQIYGLNYAAFVVPLVKAVQELSKTVDTITVRLDSSITRVKELDSAVTVLQNTPSGVSGSGTANYITKWQNANTVTTSQIFDDGTNIGIGTTSGIAKLSVATNASPIALSVGTNFSDPSGTTYGFTTGANGLNNVNIGTYSFATSATNNFGIYATSGMGSVNYGLFTTVTGSFSVPSANYGIYASVNSFVPGSTDYAGYFSGDVYSSGTYLGSDIMLKDNVAPISNAMSIIDQLQPKTFTFKTAQYPQMNLPTGDQFGLVAQDVEPILPNMIKEVIQPAVKDSAGNIVTPAVTFKSIKYEPFIPILIQGMKEEHSSIDSLKSQILDLQNQVAQLLGNNGSNAKILNSINIELANDAVLYQNIPNPFGDETMINYYIPENTTNAKIIFFDMYGQSMKEVPLTQTGSGNIHVDSKNLASGIYSYSLIINGKVIDTKKMVRNK